MYLGDYTEDYATLNFKFNTRQADGTPIAFDADPTAVIKVYKANATGSETATGVTLTQGFDGVTGLNHVLIDLSADAFYAVANDYAVVVTTGEVDGVSVAGTVLAHFSIENRFAEASNMRGTDGAITSLATLEADVGGIVTTLGTAGDGLTSIPAPSGMLTSANLPTDFETVTVTDAKIDANATVVLATEDIASIADQVVAAMPTLTGPGATSKSILINDGTNPLIGVGVWITTDLAGTNVVGGTLYTNDSGLVSFDVDVGTTYYVWCDSADADFVNPQAWTVT